MKVRIRFSKKGALVYIGHLDVMRYFQKLFRRSSIPIAYSEGFSPHQILSFSHPLPLGMESDGEYADIEITESVASKDAILRLREESVPEIEILSFKELPETCENAMASVRAARYVVEFDGKCPFNNLAETVKKFMLQEKILVTKVTKKSTKELDIKPLVYECNVSDNKVEMLISSGSIDNLKPDLVMNAIADYSNVSIEEGSLCIKRIDQYTFVNNKMISLDEIGSEII